MVAYSGHTPFIVLICMDAFRNRFMVLECSWNHEYFKSLAKLK